MATDSIASVIKSYSVPLLLLALAIFFQLFVIPSSFPVSHYDVLGIKRYSSAEEVREAYEKLSARWNSGVEIPVTVDFIKIRYAFELLTNPLWKSDYDKFGMDEQLDVIEKVKGKYLGKSFSEVDLPLLDASNSGTGGDSFNVITTEDFKTTIGSNLAWLIQVYSSGSYRCAQFSNDWKRIAGLLDGVAGTGMVELGEVELATYLAERRSTGQPFFRNGLPSLVAFPPGCRSSLCLLRYQGDLVVDAVADWFATTVLGLPRILYYSKESLGPKFLAKSGHHKVKVMYFSKTGERAAPFLRLAAKDYWAYASFAFVLWREDESSIWWNMFEVESAPAVVFLKDPGVKPVVHHGAINSSEFLNIIEQNKYQDLPQLRSLTSMELGCDARAYSRAGNDTTTWYCVILAGRPSLELNKMRETMRRVQGRLRNDDESNSANSDLNTSSIPAAEALKEKRLTFTWLDGEAQKKYCFFYLHSENSYETCGPRRGLNDVPQLFIVRYKRNSTEDETKVEKKPKTIWDTLQNDVDPASQLVARYNGSNDIPQIIQWVSQIIKDGDSRDLPLYRTKTPELIPEDADPIWSRGAQSIRSKTEGMKHKIQSVMNSIYDLLADPRLGPIFLLGALISSGSIWRRRSKSTQPSPSNQQSTKERFRSMQRNSTRLSNQDTPPSITDVEPKDAFQVLSSESDSE
ncbi:dnaJ homolog subfamily C member 16 [Macadamia integrifolia]|uniref:dnaJ homolog subfamily C member 16 n=1 Tax=Macadamia integrifolia TaxID=60698 RepID=UPI001C4E6BC4|nr:dnaJ homolog subfamily C member 16 [Macadamia integrifolia]